MIFNLTPWHKSTWKTVDFQIAHIPIAMVRTYGSMRWMFDQILQNRFDDEHDGISKPHNDAVRNKLKPGIIDVFAYDIGRMRVLYDTARLIQEDVQDYLKELGIHTIQIASTKVSKHRKIGNRGLMFFFQPGR